MTDTTIQSFAAEMKMSVDQLIQWFSYIGILKTEIGIVTQREKEILFKYMNDNKSDISKKLILQRKTRSILSVSSVGGKNKKVQIEIRKKLTYVQSTLQETEFIDVKNKMVLDANREASSLIVRNNRLVNKKISNTLGPSSLTKISKKNHRYSELIEHKEKVIGKISRKFEDKSLQDSDETQLLKKKTKNCWDIELNNTNAISSNLGDSSSNSKLYCMPELLEKNNNQKLENERRNRSRVRTRYRNGGKLTKQHKRGNHHRLYEATSDEFGMEEELYIPNRVNKSKRKQSALVQVFNKPVQTITRDIIIGQTISVAELANKMSIKSSRVIKTMMQLGIIATINQIIDQDTAQLVAEEMGHNVILRRENELEELIMNDRDIDITSSDTTLANRAPIVTIMGHVDHGKTSLLDRIRSTKIASSEVGGITQSIGAYHVSTDNGMITFLDTPGHAAFTAMRARGVQITDIVVLVVAADDGVMPQTIEAIEHIKAANVPVVVAINKIDKSEANPERIKNDLNNHGLIPEEWGGDTQFIHVSATSGNGIDNLLDAILLQSDMLELKVVHHGMARAIVIESFLDKGRGPVVAVLVREGTLKCGDIILCGTEYGRVRAMRNEFGHEITSAGPSIPVELLGLSGSPASGESVIVVRNEKKAREVALYRQGKSREIKLARQKEPNIENIFSSIKNTSVVSELNLIVKSDTKGSSEAIRESLENLSTGGDVTIKILSSSIGGITETDVALAAASNAVIVGFNVRADPTARRIIEADQLDVRYYSVIYDLIDEVKQAVHGMLAPRYKHEIIGLAKVRNVFRSPKYGNVAGCMVVEGMIKRYKKIRVIRDNIVVHEGELESLRRFKDDVNEVRSGIECGIGIKNYKNIHSGDMIEVFDMVKISHV
ncbi:translation initiation factor IF2-2 [Candidatus Blochmanniella pennsylvanica str. BPEN]|uniref:Translation initiation factor IF-2 n=1 Tax=Blochmanniella pennsylvanica (strain BPEN) TaxID=291272 RepID=IF2_BLOPB|nr:translation initiation factor IF-2 [Candidatus Blochmannia pennsylvanicus]Q493T7.1 RecName: Full=Translation initiation factor IF-2 [Candidatus Blochmannia pennsylvanicus str. BPEN]AAZ40748.1 translation initiation factor IF2-2 [Candidatus Blochmannia pennsylvanicus str. BPEN]